MALHRPKGNVIVATRRRAWAALAFRRPPSAAKAVARFRCSLGLAAGIQPSFTETGFTGVGPVQFLGGTGAYEGLAGHGTGVGATNLDTGLGGGTTTGFARLQ